MNNYDKNWTPKLLQQHCNGCLELNKILWRKQEYLPGDKSRVYIIADIIFGLTVLCKYSFQLVTIASCIAILTFIKMAEASGRLKLEWEGAYDLGVVIPFLVIVPIFHYCFFFVIEIGYYDFSLPEAYAYISNFFFRKLWWSCVHYFHVSQICWNWTRPQ